MNNQQLPKVIKRKRENTYTEKRNPYKSYLYAKWEWSEVFNEIDKLKNTNKFFLKETSKKYGIKYDTLAHKYNFYCNNKDVDFNKETRGGSNKIFTINDEKELYENLKLNFMDKNKPLNNSIVKEIALNIIKDKDKKIKFNASNGWCNMFKKRWNLSTQTVKCSRIATNIPTENDIELFLDDMENLKVRIKKKFFSTMMKLVVIL
jgi:hypothetical protein